MTLTPRHRLPRITGLGGKGQCQAVYAEIAEYGRKRYLRRVIRILEKSDHLATWNTPLRSTGLRISEPPALSPRGRFPFCEISGRAH